MSTTKVEAPMGKEMTIATQKRGKGMSSLTSNQPDKILVTGGCGFLGSHICELFKSEGWEVLSYDNLTKFEFSRAFNPAKLEAIRDYNLKFLESIGVPNIVADVRDLKTLEKYAQGANLIAHCAAQPAMTVAIEEPLMDFEVNVRGTLNVLEAAKKVGAAVANCSTIHVYGEGLNIGLLKANEAPTRLVHFASKIPEGLKLLQGTVSPLHASKLSAEHYVQAYADSYDLPAVNFRLTGIYGPRQFGGEDHGWVANFAIRTLLDQPIKVFGTAKQVRDILYVRDAARAFYKWYTQGCPKGTYNLGGGERAATSIVELLDLLEALTGKRSPMELLPKRLGDLWWFISDSSRAKEDFRWSPHFLPPEGVPQLLSWIEQERRLF